MIASPGRLTRTLLIGAILALGQAAAVSAASPSPSQRTPPLDATLVAEPAVITAAVQPGSRGTATLTLRAMRGLDITIDPMGLGQSPDDGSFNFLNADEDQSPYSARSYIGVDPASFRLEAGDSRQVTVTVSLPADVTDGERYALLRVNGQPVASDGNVGIGVALGVSVLVTQPGATEVLTGAIQDLNLGTVVPGQPVTVTGTIMNTGNTHYGASPSVVYETATLKNQAGDSLATTRGAISGNSVLPTFGRAFELTLQPGQQLAAGHYTIDVEVGLQDKAVLDQATADFHLAGGGPSTPPLVGPSPDVLWLILAGLGGAAIAVVLVVLGPRRPRRSASS